MKARIPQNQGQSMNEMLRKAQQMQSDAEQKQSELDECEYSAESGSGAVKVTVTGKHRVIKLSINPEVIDPDDGEMLEDLIMTAVNKAVAEAEETAANEMEKITGSLNIPGMPGLGL